MAYKLLLADDSITIQKVVELTLSEEGFDVTAVGDGEAALDAARKLVPDVVLADVFMPKMDGYALCEKIKSDPALSGVPVMLLSGTFEEFDEQKAAAVRSDDRLTKPFESAELISKVRQLVERRGAQPAAAAAPAAVEAAQEADANDLWSVVDMSSEEQPLSGGTDVINEEDLWKRANLVSEVDEAEALPEEGMPIEDLSAEPFEDEGEIPVALEEDAAEVEPFAEALPDYGDEADKTAVLNMEDLHASIKAPQEEEVQPIEVAETTFEPDIMSFDSLGEATAAADFATGPQPATTQPATTQPATTQPSAAPAASSVPSADMIRAEVMNAAQSIIDAKVKEALASMAGDMIERIVWEVVPELAEEIIQKEIDRIKAGS